MHPSGPPTLDPTPSTMRITVDESDDRTRARVELAWAGRNLAGTGVAYRHPSDYLNDHARQEMATAPPRRSPHSARRPSSSRNSAGPTAWT